MYAVHTHTHTHTHTHIYIYIYVCVYIYIYSYVYMYVHVKVGKYDYVNTQRMKKKFSNNIMPKITKTKKTYICKISKIK